MSSTEDAIDQPNQSVGSSPKKSRYDGSSSEDDDYYSNFDKMLERNKKTHKTAPKSEPVSTKAPTPKLLSSSDSESDVEEIKEENTLEMLLKKGKKFNEDREKKICAEMDKIKELAKVNEAEAGAIPDMVYSDPIAAEAEKRLRLLKEDRRNAFERRSSLDSSYVERVVLDNYGRERMERDYGSPHHEKGSHSRKGPEVTFLLQDLHKNDSKIEKMPHEASMRSFVERITKRWECKETEVVLTLEGTPVTDLDLSPIQLDVSLEGIHTISAVFVPAIKCDKPIEAPAAPRDPNMISIKFQSGAGKPAIIDMNKTTSFSEIIDEVAERLKMETVGRMVFDCEKVDFSTSPSDLDMEDGDCMDVYAA